MIAQGSKLVEYIKKLVVGPLIVVAGRIRLNLVTLLILSNIYHKNHYLNRVAHVEYFESNLVLASETSTLQGNTVKPHDLLKI